MPRRRLPLETIQHIIFFAATDIKTAKNGSLTCRALRRTAQKSLFHDLTITSDPRVENHPFRKHAMFFLKHPHIGSYIRTLTLRGRDHNHLPHVHSYAMWLILNGVPNLTVLHLSMLRYCDAPLSDNDDEEQDHVQLRDLLSNLKTLTLHDSVLDVTEFTPIHFLPLDSVEHISVKDVEWGGEWEEKESIFQAPGLSTCTTSVWDIAAAPFVFLPIARNLVSLNIEYAHSSCAAALTQTLEACQHCLEQLCITFPVSRTTLIEFTNSLSFASFSRLARLHIGIAEIDSRYLRATHLVSAMILALTSRLPPTITFIAFTTQRISSTASRAHTIPWEAIADNLTSLPNLRRVVALIYARTGNTSEGPSPTLQMAQMGRRLASMHVPAICWYVTAYPFPFDFAWYTSSVEFFTHYDPPHLPLLRSESNIPCT